MRCLKSLVAVKISLDYDEGRSILYGFKPKNNKEKQQPQNDNA